MNKKKKIIIAIMIVNSILLVGCGNRNYQTETDNDVISQEEVFDAGKYNKEVDKYTLTTRDNKADISFSLAKDLNYTGTSNKDKIELTNKDLSAIEITVYNVKKDNKEINKTEKDYNAKEYYDYKEIKIDNLTGYQVFRKKNSNINFESTFKILEDNNVVYAISINIYGKDKDNYFDAGDIVNSNDFKYLLHSIKIKEKENSNE